MAHNCSLNSFVFFWVCEAISNDITC